MGRRGRPAARTVPPRLAIVGNLVEAMIERIVPGGRGLAHAEGLTLFIAGAAPGDRARVRIERAQGRAVFARVEEVLEASPDRVPVPHPTLARCGIDFQHLRYPAQLEAKKGIVLDSLRRIGGIESPPGLEVVASTSQWGYRGRAEWRHDPERGALGYLESGTHRVIDLPEDPMIEAAVAAGYQSLRERLAAGGLPADETEFRVGAGDDGSLSISPSPAAEPAIVTRQVAGETYDSDADCFFQPNPGIVEPLLTEALRHAPEPGGPSSQEERPALDLYCGVGLFTLPLARRFGRVVGVESHRRTAAFAARNAEAAGLKGVRIETMPVERWSAAAYRTFGRTPFALVDPPRVGIPVPALRGLVRLRPERIAYVSCDPATLARDLKLLLAEGWALDGLAAFDMFPQTHHVEVVAHLARVG